jgi:hypothetical protein
MFADRHISHRVIPAKAGNPVYPNHRLPGATEIPAFAGMMLASGLEETDP